MKQQPNTDSPPPLLKHGGRRAPAPRGNVRQQVTKRTAPPRRTVNLEIRGSPEEVYFDDHSVKEETSTCPTCGGKRYEKVRSRSQVHPFRSFIDPGAIGLEQFPCHPYLVGPILLLHVDVGGLGLKKLPSGKRCPRAGRKEYRLISKKRNGPWQRRFYLSRQGSDAIQTCRLDFISNGRLQAKQDAIHFDDGHGDPIHCDKVLPLQQNLRRTSPAGFEPALPEGNGLAGHRVNHSAKATYGTRCVSNERIPQQQRTTSRRIVFRPPTVVKSDVGDSNGVVDDLGMPEAGWNEVAGILNLGRRPLGCSVTSDEGHSRPVMEGRRRGGRRNSSSASAGRLVVISDVGDSSGVMENRGQVDALEEDDGDHWPGVRTKSLP
ncbi:hypothetical protein BDK51DRAFT_40933 [Blyttiomyces helicus]|uniref:Uncharacterized protein n=1 Tax=Blyttiomyces helicus TaxID=388810 RepID=A0A4P9WJS1_9FUNG|nr:hypothetical protein BDK51DRAFT_40933 [Blyttiomyces helicus]|eukprot:RKO92213.1 hypothetical protein BDK51DRAFT_40933 [Blyttiomyces helicus]